MLYTSPFRLKETTTPTDPEIPSDVLAFYAKDKAGVSALYYKDDAFVEHDLSGGLTGTGVANRLAFWTGATTLDDVPRTLTPGSVLFAGSDFLPQEDNSGLFYDDTNNDLIVGHTANPFSSLVGRGLAVVRNSGFAEATVGEFGAGTMTTALRLMKAGGTASAPTATQSGMGGVVGLLGYGATAFSGARALVRFVAGENWTDAAQGAYITLETTPLLGATSAERFRVGPSGEWGIGGATYGTSGQALLSGGSGAPPTWGSAGVTDHGGLTGLLDDDHALYLLASDATSRAAFAANWLDLTDGGETTLHSHAGGQTPWTSDINAAGFTLSGNTTVGGSLILKSTTGVGTTDHIKFLVGNNGGTEAIRIQHSGEVDIGTTTASGSQLEVNAIASGLHGLTLRSSGAGHALRILNAIGTDLFHITSTGHMTLNALQYIDFAHGGQIGDPDQIITAGGDALGIVATTNIFFATGGTTKNLILDARGNLILSSAISSPSSGTRGLIFADGTALATMASNTAGLYADDIAGNVSMHVINENGDIIKLIKTGTYTPTNVGADRSYDADSTTVDELADVLGTLIADLQLTGLLG